MVLDGMRKSQVPGSGGAGVGGFMQRRIGDRSFYLVQGVWVDRAYREEMRGRVETVEAFGDEYFALLQDAPELAQCFAFSSRILVVLGDRVLEVQ